jgi:hypothetical protein
MNCSSAEILMLIKIIHHVFLNKQATLENNDASPGISNSNVLDFLQQNFTFLAMSVHCM